MTDEITTPKFTMYNAEAVDLHAGGASYEVSEEGVTELWIAELADGCVAIMILYDDDDQARISYRGNYTIWWTTEEAGERQTTNDHTTRTI